MAKHHYVSKFYYKNFVYSTDDPLVYTMNKEGKISNRRRAASQIGYETDYNTPDQEQTQSQLETRYAKILREFIKAANQEECELSFSDRFLEFVSFMIGNNIFVRKKLTQGYSVEKIVQNGVELDNKLIADRGYKGKHDLSVSFSGRVYKEFQNWVWKLIRLNVGGSRGHFITSDNPVNMFNPENVGIPVNVKLKYDWSKTKVVMSNRSENRIDMTIVVTLESVSFGDDVVMTFPLTPELCLIGFSCSQRHDSFQQASKRKFIEFVNSMRLIQCNKAVYSHSEELLSQTKNNLLGFRNYCDEKNIVPSFEVGIQ